MFRNQYDSDVSIFSPQGRLHQLEYAMEAVKLGSATIGLKNTLHAVLVCYNKTTSELANFQKKIIPLDNHTGMSFSGLTADAKILSRYLRLECLNHRYFHGTSVPISRLVYKVANKMQICTQCYNRRPYGLGMLIAGFDDLGPHIFWTCPTANFFDCKAMAIGARSQSARTYLEKKCDQFEESSLEEIIIHGLSALRATLPAEIFLTPKNVSLATVGIDRDFELLDDAKIDLYLNAMNASKSTTSTDLARNSPERSDSSRKNSGDMSGDSSN